jgi:hypothetical protein
MSISRGLGKSAAVNLLRPPAPQFRRLIEDLPCWKFLTLERMTMADQPKAPVSPPKKKIVRCEQTCAYIGSGRDAPRCKNRCSQEVGHVLSCKCKTHEMQ